MINIPRYIILVDTMHKELLWAIGGLLVLGLLAVFFLSKIPQNEALGPQNPLAFELPNGFTATLFSDDVPGVRVLTRDSKGTIVASLTEQGRVAALPNRDTDPGADRVVTVLSGLNKPHGIVFIGDILYVAEEGSVTSYIYNADTFSATYIETLATLPTGGGHSTRSLLVW